jgi:putative Mn2+ efflux pump MntP
MNIAEIFLLAAALSMDAFAVAVCAGLSMDRASIKNALTVGLYFGVFQAAMPVIGYFAATRFAETITAYSHWVVFALLLFLGGKMIAGSFKKGAPEKISGGENQLRPAKMLPLAVATSVDALAVGVSFAFLRADIVSAVLIIGVITLVLSMLGVKIGNVFGAKFKSRAELAGGVILALMGLRILLDHLEAI